MIPARGVYGPDVGGTSFGCATGLSAGLFAAAVGGKTAGSVIRPSTLAALYGMEPSLGLITGGSERSLGVSPDWDGSGPMGKTAEDVAMLLDVLVRAEDRGCRSYVDALAAARRGPSCIFRIAVHDPDRIRRDTTDGGHRTRAFDKAVGRLAEHPQIELVVPRATPDSVKAIAGLESRAPFYRAFQAQLDVDAYNSLTEFLANQDGAEVNNVEELLQWQIDHPVSAPRWNDEDKLDH